MKHVTLASQLVRPLFQARNMATVPVSWIAAYIREDTQALKGSANPQQSALSFYAGSHHFALLRAKFHQHEPLPAEHGGQAVLWSNYSHDLLMRAFVYTLVICHREARHLKNGTEMRDKVVQKWGPVIGGFVTAIPDNASTAVSEFIAKAPDVRLTDFVEALHFLFNHGKWASQYGGKAWGNVAHAVLRFVNGETSGEIFLDTVWTLSHNTSAIFNKGMWFEEQNPTLLLRILDVQRAGRVPNAILNDPKIANETPFLARDSATLAATLDPALGQPVDWQEVMTLGAVGDYSHMVKAKPAAPPKMAPKPKPKEFGDWIQDGLKTFAPIPGKHPAFPVVVRKTKIAA